MPEIKRLVHGVTLFARDDYTLRATVGEHQIGDGNLAPSKGDPLDPASANGRYIMPASYKSSVGYEF